MTGHTPVLLAEMLAALNVRDGGTYVDGTFGGGGYTRAILAAADCRVLAIDRDPEAVARAEPLLRGSAGRLTVVEARFGDLASLVTATLSSGAARGVDGVVFDIGVSSFQIDTPERGFSFRADGPLDMRMGGHGMTAAEFVARASEREIADVLHTLGEERRARAVAKTIAAARAEGPITRTGQLAGIIRRVVPADKSGIDPATRSFQAIRIHVNDELGELSRGLSEAADALAPGGRLVAVTFHSLEDRIVKTFFAQAAGTAPRRSRHDPGGLLPDAAPAFRAVTRKPVTPGDAEMRDNPRARSGKLRAIERIAA